jgi:hypothetical protein
MKYFIEIVYCHFQCLAFEQTLYGYTPAILNFCNSALGPASPDVVEKRHSAHVPRMHLLMGELPGWY